MTIQFLDLRAQYNSIKPEIDQAIQGVLDSCKFIMGGEVKEFEKEVAAYCQAEFGVSCASGTDALLLSLLACGVKEGDTVITTPFTFIATTEAISKIGAKIAFCDIDEKTFNIDPEKIRECVEKNKESAKAILPVHLYGHPADMDPIMEIAREYGLKVIEDCAQAIGATYKEKPVGSIGHAGCFSFFPSKNLGCAGDGGVVVTQDDARAEKLRVLRMHGSKPKYYHAMIGGNFRFDALQAAVVSVKLPHLDGWTAGRQANADRYRRLFAEAGLVAPEGPITLPEVAAGGRHIYNQFVIRVPRRDELRVYLQEHNVGTEVYYPVPLHLQECFAYLGYREGDFPESERAAAETLALPVYPELSERQARHVVDTLGGFFASCK